MPVRGPEAWIFSANVDARGVKLPVADGVNITADAKLDATYRLGLDRGQRAIPDVKGTVELTQFSYTRPIALNLSLSQLGRRAGRQDVDTYDPDNDLVRFNVNLVSPRPLRFSNNLVEMDLEITNPGLIVSGTNQRYSARGHSASSPTPRSSFAATSSWCARAPCASTTRRRSRPRSTCAPRPSTAATPRARSSLRPPAPRRPTPTGPAGRRPRPSRPRRAPARRACGASPSRPAARPTTSESRSTAIRSLSQEDIVLLLTLGMTRAELDRGATAAFGQGLGLEALSALTGADKAVKTVVPLIDDFRFGTGYSSKTASPEPTVTVGKRITDSVRASVTTGLSEDREVRSNIEWRLNRNLSIQGSYDNLNDVSSSPVGNVGVDLRWRLEFEWPRAAKAGEIFQATGNYSPQGARGAPPAPPERPLHPRRWPRFQTS